MTFLAQKLKTFFKAKKVFLNGSYLLKWGSACPELAEGGGGGFVVARHGRRGFFLLYSP
jgi:hypothetical protein